MEPSSAALRQECASLGVALEPGQASRILAHLEELARWNQKHNLVGPGTLADWTERHSLDSLAAARFLPSGSVGIDVGSGAGFPGIPLAIARPDCQFTLVEPRMKRAAFLRSAIAKLDLKNVRVEGRIQLRSRLFDFALSRAVWPLGEWLSRAAPLIGDGGRAIAFLGRNPLPDERLAEEGARNGLRLVETVQYKAGKQPAREVAVFEKAPAFHVEQSPVA
ncbi:MAG TPA: 16S rRNA (guanine(527)-N(7))-methyltransferase RsmG [Myxococcales bacterium]|nr:16S rRNA (guanine(527)-N(7))-methyltransferase RsmG [Myxococcales bacterium]